MSPVRNADYEMQPSLKLRFAPGEATIMHRIDARITRVKTGWLIDCSRNCGSVLLHDDGVLAYNDERDLICIPLQTPPSGEVDIRIRADGFFVGGVKFSALPDRDQGTYPKFKRNAAMNAAVKALLSSLRLSSLKPQASSLPLVRVGQGDYTRDLNEEDVR